MYIMYMYTETADSVRHYNVHVLCLTILNIPDTSFHKYQASISQFEYEQLRNFILPMKPVFEG